MIVQILRPLAHKERSDLKGRSKAPAAGVDIEIISALEITRGCAQSSGEVLGFGAIIGFLVKYYISRQNYTFLHLPSGLGVITGGSLNIMFLSEDSSPVYQLVRAVHQKPEITSHRLQEGSGETVMINWTYCDLLSSSWSEPGTMRTCWMSRGSRSG